jgi:hypothetical protein
MPKCPIITTDSSNPQNCLEGDCAWWIKDLSRCTVVNVSTTLAGMKTAVYDLSGEVRKSRELAPNESTVDLD